jgi:hypothetical protein
MCKKLSELSKVENELGMNNDFTFLSIDSLLSKNGITNYAKIIEKKNEFKDIEN